MSVLPNFVSSSNFSIFLIKISVLSPFPVTPALADLQLTTVGSDSVQVDWEASGSALRGYWLTWEEQQQNSISAQRSSFYLPPDSRSTRLTNIPPSARVCVSPIYRTARGDGLCCTAQFHTGEIRVQHSHLRFQVEKY